MEPELREVSIVGGRANGLALAVALRRQGWRAAYLDSRLSSLQRWAFVTTNAPAPVVLAARMRVMGQ